MRSALILATRDELFSIEPETGALFWHVSVPDLRRLFEVGTALCVLTGRGVSFLELESGKALREVKLEFGPTAGLVTGDRLYVAGPGGAAALTATGDLLWSAKSAPKGGFSLKHFLSCKNAQGVETWREETAFADGRNNPGLLLGEQIAQPDLDFN